jgi:hypothetical protein
MTSDLVINISRLSLHCYVSSGRYASRVYVGQEDFYDLRVRGEVHLARSVLENRDVYFTQGLRIYVVDEKNHLHVC